MEGPGLPAAPVFRPSAEEWQDPLSYLAYVRQHADTVGIAKIVPPEGWQPPFVIDKKRLKFRTRLQSVHQLQTRDSGAAVKQFWDSFNAFMDGTGSRLKKKPMFAGQEIDLYRLYRLVQKRGGYDAVNEDKSWKDIVACLQVSEASGDHFCCSLAGLCLQP